MRFYLLDSFKLRLFKQKEDVRRLTISQPVDLGTPEPLPVPKPPPRQNEGAHRVLDQIQAVHDWWTIPPKFMQPQEPKPKGPVPTEVIKPVEQLALRELPDSEERTGLKTDAAMMRQWFKNPAYAVQSKEQKQCAKGAALYPPELVNASILKMDTLLKSERFMAVYDRIRSAEFLTSKPVKDALAKSLEWVQSYGSGLNPAKDLKGDLQRMHRKYVFASLPVSKAFPEVFADVRAGEVEKSADTLDDVALGGYRLYVAVDGGHVLYNGNYSNKVVVDSIAAYVMVPYGFDDLGPEPEYRGHANKKLFGVVVDGGTWMGDAVYKG